MGNLLFCGDNIYKDSCVGVIDAHHGSDMPDFIDVAEAHPRATTPSFCCPATAPSSAATTASCRKAIDRLTQYQYMADFGTCAIDWPLLDEWEADVIAGRMPKLN